MKNKEIEEIANMLKETEIKILTKIDLLIREYLNSEKRILNFQRTKSSSLSIPFLLHGILKKIDHTINIVDTRSDDVDYIKACLKATRIEVMELRNKVLPIKEPKWESISSIREPSMPVEETREWEKRR